MTKKKKCRDCAFLHTPKCSYIADFQKGLMTPTDDACPDFYEKKKEKKKKFVPKKDSGSCDQGYFEAIFNTAASFLVKTENGFDLLDVVTIEAEEVQPKTPRMYPYKPYGVYKDPLPTVGELWRMIRTEFEHFLDVEPIWKDVSATCVLLSYQQEKLVTVPYLYYVGDNESGKSTALQLLESLCYRPLYGVSIPSADVYGYLGDSDTIPTILEDEIQGIRKDIDKTKIYKAGYKIGAKVPRTILLKHDRVIKYYNTFCFKAFASEKLPFVKGFIERCIFIPMVEGYPKKEWADLSKQDITRFQTLRNMLLKWRLETRDNPLPGLQVSFRGRIKELWKPILQVAYDTPIYETLFNFVDNQIKERLDRKQNTLEGHIVKAVVKLYHSESLPFSNIWNFLLDDLRGRVDANKFHKMFTADFDMVSKQKVGYRLREVLTGKRKVIRLPDGLTRVWDFDEDKLRRIAKKYGYEFVTKLPLLPISEGVSPLHSIEKPLRNNVRNEQKHSPTLPLIGNKSNTVTNPKLIVCPLCANKGQQVTFLTKQDLDIHMQKVHGLPEVE